MPVRLPRLRSVVLAALALMGAVLVAFALMAGYVVLGFRGNAVYPADCGVVFGAAVAPVFDANREIVDVGAGPGIQRRVAAAADLYKDGKVRRFIFSGGSGEGMPDSEAEVMRRTAIAQGIAASDIRIETGSHSTYENLVNVRPLLSDCASVVGISDRYHLARIGLIASRLQIPLTTAPASPAPNRYFELQSVVREVFGIIQLLLLQA